MKEHGLKELPGQNFNRAVTLQDHSLWGTQGEAPSERGQGLSQTLKP